MDDRLGTVRAAAARAAPRGLVLLEDWLRIPSISGSPRHAAEVDRAAQWVADLLRRGTPRVTTRRTAAGPVVVARTAGRRREAPLTVVYGHLDVKPPGPGWTTPPFAPTRVGTRLRARGASDDKGQLMAHLVALAAWSAAGGPPGDVVTIVDGAEEVGSPGLAPLLASLRRDLLAGPVGAVVVVDTRATGPGRPTVTLSQRGSLGLLVTVEVGGAPVHAGRLGGAVIDPTLVLAGALLRAARLLERTETARIPGAAEPDDAAVRALAGRRAVHADAPAARASTRGALTVSRVAAQAATGAVPVRASARVDVRLPPGLAPRRALPALERALCRGLPRGVRLTLTPSSATTGHRLAPEPRVLAAVRAAGRAAFGRTPVGAASGGSIPAVGVLARVFGTDPVLLGLGPADDGAHGPDEHLDTSVWPACVDTHVVLLATVGSIARNPDAERVPGRRRSATVESVVESWGSRETRSGVT